MEIKAYVTLPCALKIKFQFASDMRSYTCYDRYCFNGIVLLTKRIVLFMRDHENPCQDMVRVSGRVVADRYLTKTPLLLKFG